MRQAGGIFSLPVLRQRLTPKSLLLLPEPSLGILPIIKTLTWGRHRAATDGSHPLPGLDFLPSLPVYGGCGDDPCLLGSRQEARTQRGPFLYRCAGLYKRLKAQGEGGRHLGQPRPVVMLLARAELTELNIPSQLLPCPKASPMASPGPPGVGSRTPPSSSCAHQGTGCPTFC